MTAVVNQNSSSLSVREQQTESGEKRGVVWVRRWLTGAAVAMTLGMAFSLPQQAFGQEPAVGLSGLLPNELPEAIGTINLDSEAWGTWGEELRTDLSKLYSFENHSLEVQQESLASLEKHLARIDKELANPEARGNYPVLVDLEGKLTRRVELFQAILSTLKGSPDQAEQLRPLLQKLVHAIEGYEADSLEGKSAGEVRQLVHQIGGLVEDNSALEEVVRIHYYNFNIRTFVSEPFAEYIFNECRKESGAVVDCILGANVRGSQTTRSGVSIDFLPCDEAAAFSIDIEGNTRSNTRGVNRQATVYTHGDHYFSGQKTVFLADDEFGWERGVLRVSPNNTVLDAHLNRRGLLAKLIGDRIAYNKAVDLTPQTESVAASRVRGRVLPKFNREIENTFSELNESRAKLRDRMAQESIAPNETLARSDEDELRIAERLMNAGQLGADRPTRVFNSSTGITVQIHESWINNSLARGTLNVQKEEMTFPEFGRLLTEKFERAFQREFEREAAEEDGDLVLVYDADPFHVRFSNSKVYLVLRIGLRQAGRDDVIKLRRVEIPLKILIEGDEIRLAVSDDEADRVRVLPLDPSDRRPIANRIMGEKIRTKVEQRLAGKTFDRHVMYKTNREDAKEFPVTIAELHTVNGWLIAVAEPTSEADLERLKDQKVDAVGVNVEEKAEVKPPGKNN